MLIAMKNIVRKIYLYRAFDDFILIYPLYAVMFISRGLSTVQIASLFIVWSLTSIAVEVPSGALADKYSRKNLLFIGQLIRALGYLAWIVFPNYAGFMAGFVLWGIGGAFASGTFEALVYDELKAHDQQSQFVRIKGRADSYALVAILLASILASLAIAKGYNFVLALSILPVLISGFIAFLLPNTARIKSTGEAGYFKTLKQGIREALHNKTVLRIALLGGFVGAVYGSLEEFDPLFLLANGLSNSTIPTVSALLTAATAGASFIAYKYEKVKNVTFLLLLAFSGLALLLAASLYGPGGIALFLVYLFIIMLLVVVFEGKLQHSITSNLRATITSVSFFLMEVMAISMYFLFGYLADKYTALIAFKTFGFLSISFAFVYMLIESKILNKESLAEVKNQKKW